MYSRSRHQLCLHRIGLMAHVRWLIWLGASAAENVPEHPMPSDFRPSRPDLLLPNYDCRDTLERDPENLLTSWTETQAVYLITGSPRASGPGEAEEDDAIWFNYVTAFQEHIHQDLEADCPFAFFVLKLCLWFSCRLLLEHHEACAAHGASAPMLGRDLLAAGYYGLRNWETLGVFLNSRWARPFCKWVHGALALAPKLGLVSEDLVTISSCPVPRSGEWLSDWNWQEHLHLLLSDSVEAAALTMNPSSVMNWEVKVTECPLGLLNILLHQILLCMTGISEMVPYLSEQLTLLLTLVETELREAGIEVLPVLMATRWPMLRMLTHVAVNVQRRNVTIDQVLVPHYQTKPYVLDFHPHELLYPEAERLQLPAGRSSQSLRFRRHGLGVSKVYRRTLQFLESTLSLEPSEMQPKSPIIFTMIFGERLAKYLPKWLLRVEAFGHLSKTLVFCLDSASMEACRAAHAHQGCVQGSLRTASNKFHMMSVILNSGFDVLYLDFDLVLLQDPLPSILRHAEEAELLLTRDFGGECINIGVVYMKSHPSTSLFVQGLIRWLWNHPYEFCQKAFAGMMGLEDVTWNDQYGDPVRSVPRWGFLDSANSFATSTVYDASLQGWTGDLQKILIYHFLDGLGAVDPELAVTGEYTDLFTLFYQNPLLNLGDTQTPLHEQDASVRKQLLFTRQPAPPSQLQACGHYETSAYPAWKKRQREKLQTRLDIRPVQLH